MIVPALALLAAGVWQAPQAPAAAGTGRIEGVATISSQLTPRARVRVYANPGDPAPTAPRDSNPLANVVLYLESAPALRGRPAPQGPAPALRQHGERFEPHVLAVMVGTSVAFPNDDPIFHNVFSLSRVSTFDLGRYPRGSSKSVRFDRPGVVQVFCHIHADMAGYILVLDNPFFVTPGADGRYALDGVPPGDYRLVAWHERIRPLVTPVHVEAGRTTAVNLRIPLPEVPAPRSP